ncbi:hypothetical protein [Singulisphaera acidiphila]|uniref:Uncharacterized protein n=1 Tax=Singulisphaera acidiphila (strain ATCC BAA-1392 / DSM 18658 / VKM B-2454 / MOB10) TaxID=886293 RepID=L0DHU7_SINAD|nr:hypothetical protein [Singulisphaera acidiphila]AGA28415.1 hypothetical protein Sinac_4211 [Singulisphaera acidiphila DSM 18658]
MRLRLHSPGITPLQSLLGATQHVETILGPFLLVGADALRLRRVEAALAEALEAADTLRREVEGALADGNIAVRFSDEDALARVGRAEREALGESSCLHPLGCGGCDWPPNELANRDTDRRAS